MTEPRDHYSYTVYADPATARSFDERRFGGVIGELVASEQASVLSNMVGRIHDRRILDVGTGTGRAALLFARGGAHVTGVDASEQMLAIARHRAAEEHASVTFLPGDAHDLDFADRAFDVVVSLRVLMHTPRWQTCIHEMCRVADRLVIVDYPSAHSAALVQSVGRKILHAFGGRTEPYRVFTDAEIAEAFRHAGYRIRSTHRQFVLPIALHKTLASPRFTRMSERWLGGMGLLKLLGSPVTLVAERCVIS